MTLLDLKVGDEFMMPDGDTVFLVTQIDFGRAKMVSYPIFFRSPAGWRRHQGMVAQRWSRLDVVCVKVKSEITVTVQEP